MAGGFVNALIAWTGPQEGDMGHTRLTTVAVAVAFTALGCTLGSAQARQPEFELVITAPGGSSNTTPEG